MGVSRVWDQSCNLVKLQTTIFSLYAQLADKEGEESSLGSFFFIRDLIPFMGFPGVSVVKNPPAKQETRVQTLGQEDPLEKEMATHSTILAKEIPQTEEPGGLESVGSKKVGHNLVTKQQQQQQSHS